jgi:hypothetical protein
LRSALPRSGVALALALPILPLGVFAIREIGRENM